MDCRAIEDRAIDAEPGAVAWAIPALVERIPVNVTAEMGADRLTRVRCTLVVAISGNLLQSVPHGLAADCPDRAIKAYSWNS